MASSIAIHAALTSSEPHALEQPLQVPNHIESHKEQIIKC